MPRMDGHDWRTRAHVGTAVDARLAVILSRTTPTRHPRSGPTGATLAAAESNGGSDATSS